MKASFYHGKELPVQVLRSGAGFYLGTLEDGMPFTNEGDRYYRTTEEAQAALEKWERDCEL